MEKWKWSVENGGWKLAQVGAFLVAQRVKSGSRVKANKPCLYVINTVSHTPEENARSIVKYLIQRGFVRDGLSTDCLRRSGLTDGITEDQMN